MNKMQINEQPWLDLLVDDELSPDRRRMLIDHLERSPDGWKRCAMAFLNEQRLAQELRALEMTQPVAKLDCRASLDRRTMTTHAAGTGDLARSKWFPAATVLAAFLCAVCGAVVGFSWGTSSVSESGAVGVAADVALADVLKTIADLRENAAEENQSDPSEVVKETRLIEIIDNEYLSIFDTPDLLPPLILESLVLAGHQVEIRRPEEDDLHAMNRIVVTKIPSTF